LSKIVFPPRFWKDAPDGAHLVPLWEEFLRHVMLMSPVVIALLTQVKQPEADIENCILMLALGENVAPILRQAEKSDILKKALALSFGPAWTFMIIDKAVELG
jgi:hypothetical protein